MLGSAAEGSSSRACSSYFCKIFAASDSNLNPKRTKARQAFLRTCSCSPPGVLESRRGSWKCKQDCCSRKARSSQSYLRDAVSRSTVRASVRDLKLTRSQPSLNPHPRPKRSPRPRSEVRDLGGAKEELEKAKPFISDRTAALKSMNDKPRRATIAQLLWVCWSRSARTFNLTAIFHPSDSRCKSFVSSSSSSQFPFLLFLSVSSSTYVVNPSTRPDLTVPSQE